jgi:putative membrane protein
MKTIIVATSASALLFLTLAPSAALAEEEKKPGKAATAQSTDAAAKADRKTAGKLDRQEEQFVKKAAQAGLKEVKLGEVAKAKATNPDLKQFGDMMTSDHSGANQELKTIASSKGIELSDELDGKHKSDVDRMSSLAGEEFDKAYAAEMLKDHKMAVADFEKASQDCKDPDLKAFAGKTLPTLKMHLDRIQEIQGKKSR